MYADTRQNRFSDLRAGGAASLVVHAALLSALAVAVTHARAVFVPPALQTIRLDVNAPAPVSAESALPVPSASPVQSSVPQVAAPPRPNAAPAGEERFDSSASPLDISPTATETVAPGGPLAVCGVTTFVVTEPTSGKNIFGTGVEGLPVRVAAVPGPGSNAAPVSVGRGDRGIGVEGPISLRHELKPEYPMSCRRRGEQGCVILEALVGTNGAAVRVAVVNSSGIPELDRAATRAVASATFIPATEDNRNVEARARITIIFQLTK